MEDRISIDISGGVADVRLIRSDKMNALDDKMFKALIAATEALNADKSVRCVVLSGEGRAFCAGLDMGNFGKMADGAGSGVSRQPLEVRTHGIANRPQHAVWGWRQLRVPVIAAVHGVALGGGLQVMLGSDIRIVHPETKLSILEVKWGLVPDMSSTAIMRQIVREDIVRELTYTGRMFSGAEAKEYGFATHLSETPHEDAMTLAAEIASKSPDSVQTAKRLYNELPDKSDAEALLGESIAQDSLVGTKNQIESIMAGMQKRAGVFED
ncbi:MAG: crotonase/enoyl-CoA hydratase family protein [Pseudomonadota bacterium]